MQKLWDIGNEHDFIQNDAKIMLSVYNIMCGVLFRIAKNSPTNFGCKPFLFYMFKSIKGKVHCFFEQSGVFKNEFIKLGIPAEDYDIQNNFGETDHVMDLFGEIDRAYDNLTRQDKTRQDKTLYSTLLMQVKILLLLFIRVFIFVKQIHVHSHCGI